MKNFEAFTKIAQGCGRFGQINCCQRLKKVVQSPINRQIWSHWYRATKQEKLLYLNRWIQAEVKLETGKDHYMSGLQCDWFEFSRFSSFVQITTNYLIWLHQTKLNWRPAVLHKSFPPSLSVLWSVLRYTNLYLCLRCSICIFKNLLTIFDWEKKVGGGVNVTRWQCEFSIFVFLQQ